MCLIHEWSKWSEQVDGYDSTYQFRYCKKCNKSSKRKLGYAGSIRAEKINKAIDTIRLLGRKS